MDDKLKEFLGTIFFLYDKINSGEISATSITGDIFEAWEALEPQKQEWFESLAPIYARHQERMEDGIKASEAFFKQK